MNCHLLWSSSGHTSNHFLHVAQFISEHRVADPTARVQGGFHQPIVFLICRQSSLTTAQCGGITLLVSAAKSLHSAARRWSQKEHKSSSRLMCEPEKGFPDRLLPQLTAEFMWANILKHGLQWVISQHITITIQMCRNNSTGSAC